MRLWLGIAVLLFATAARAQSTAPAEDTPVATVVVPVVGTVLGVNDVQWRTDVELVNEFPSEVNVGLTLPTAPGEPSIFLTLGPGERQRFTNLVGEAFGMDSVLSPLVVMTLGRRSVTIRATVYGVRGTETFRPQPIAVDYASGYYPLRNLQGLSFSDAFRTNVGLVNLSEEPAEFLIALQKLAGRNVATTRAVLPPRSLWHAPIQMLFPMITKGDDFAIVVETGSANTYIYASVIENETNNATFVRGQVAAPPLGGP
ncbi:MAG TPA: hypothetical protein VGF69_15895 [Thermoanaerobaculia bacterium]|jgi:hypothetical protein